MDSEIEKKFSIQDYGEVILKKFTFQDKCELRGKIVQVKINIGTGKEDTTIDSSAIFYWTTLMSIKSLPDHPDFYKYPVEQKQKILDDANLEAYLEQVMSEALNYNKLNVQAIGKKNQSGNEKKTG